MAVERPPMNEPMAASAAIGRLVSAHGRAGLAGQSQGRLRPQIQLCGLGYSNDGQQARATNPSICLQRKFSAADTAP